MGHAKTWLEFIKDVIDSLATDYKEIEAVSVASNKDIANFPGKKMHSLIQSKQPSHWLQKVNGSMHKV